MSHRLITQSKLLGITTALVLTGMVPATASAESGLIPGYVVQSTGAIVRNGQGNCLRSGSWKPEMVVEACDPELYAKMHPAPAPVVVAKAEPKTEIVTVEESLGAKTLFKFNKAVLTPEGQAALAALASKLAKFENVQRVVVTGHTDRIGSKQYNQGLSERRAAAVGQYLRDNAGLPAGTVQMVGVGAAEPVVDCKGSSGRALIACLQPNRRVDIEITGERKETRTRG